MINTIVLGHALNILPQLPSESVNCVTTSPPYWGLRDYGVKPVIWDGDKDCEHEWGNKIPCNKESHQGEGKSTLRNGNVSPNENWNSGIKGKKADSNFCLKCSAWHGSLGLEPTFDLYVKHLCDIFDDVKRVLRADGTCWVNLGDSYIGGGGGNYGNGVSVSGSKTKHLTNIANRPAFMEANKVQAKSLCLIPQRFVIEMVNRGWILRNTIIWHKPNCMPSSAKDRFTVDFEYVYFFVKNKKYWFEQQFENHITQENRPNGIIRNRIFNYDSKLNKLRGFKTKQIEDETQGPQYHGKDINYGKQGRNKRAVWTIPTSPYPEAHFAVYPEGLIEIPIKAGCPEFVCKKCGKAREKIYEGKANDAFNIRVRDVKENRIKHTDRIATDKEIKNYKEKCYGGEGIKFIGYTDCGCNVGFEGGIVLDPFMGAGTTALVTLKQRKRFIGIEIKQEYIDMANKRIANIQQEIF